MCAIVRENVSIFEVKSSPINADQLVRGSDSRTADTNCCSLEARSIFQQTIPCPNTSNTHAKHTPNHRHHRHRVHQRSAPQLAASLCVCVYVERLWVAGSSHGGVDMTVVCSGEKIIAFESAVIVVVVVIVVDANCAFTVFRPAV